MRQCERHAFRAGMEGYVTLEFSNYHAAAREDLCERRRGAGVF
jgi:hypothetical protein